MPTPALSPRLAVLATDPFRRGRLVEYCRSSIPDADVEPVRDLVELIIRVAAGAADVVVVDGPDSEVLPEDSAAVLKGLREMLQVVIVDAVPGAPVPHRVDHLMNHAQLGPWLARQFPRDAA